MHAPTVATTAVPVQHAWPGHRHGVARCAAELGGAVGPPTAPGVVVSGAHELDLLHAPAGDDAEAVVIPLPAPRPLRRPEPDGGFEERIDHDGGEDWEWAHRAWLTGAGFAHLPDAAAWHDDDAATARIVVDVLAPVRAVRRTGAAGIAHPEGEPNVEAWLAGWAS